MNIGFNCARIDPNYFGGVTTYTQGLLSGFEGQKNSDSIQLYVTSLNNHLFKNIKSKKIEKIILPYSFFNLKFRFAICKFFLFVLPPELYRFTVDYIFSSWIKIIENNSDVLYTPTTVAFPYKLNIPTIVSMHDIQHVHFKNFFSFYEIKQRKVQFYLTAKYTSFLQVSSKFMKEDILNNFNFLKPKDIIVISEGVDLKKFKVKKNNTILKKYNLPNKYLFFPAQLWPHKNHILVLRALYYLQNENIRIPLVLTGAKFSAYSQIINFIKKNNLENVIYLGLVNQDDMIQLFKNANFFITAVLYESSSLPFLESAASGVPIFASKIKPNEEMAKNLNAILFSPHDHIQLAFLIKKHWANSYTKRTHVSHNNNNIYKYSWKLIAKKYTTFFYKLIK